MQLIADFFFRTSLYLLAAIAGATGFYMVTKWKTISTQKKLVGLMLISLVCHMIEERVYPSGFGFLQYAVNGSIMSEAGVFMCNTLVILLFTFIFWKFSEKPWVLITMTVMGIGELVMHISLGMASLEAFRDAGQVIPYTPGMFTALFFLVPISVGSVVLMIKNRVFSFKNKEATLNTLKTIGCGFLTMMIIMLGMILLPRALFMETDVDVQQLDPGYYSQYLDIN